MTKTTKKITATKTLKTTDIGNGFARLESMSKEELIEALGKNFKTLPTIKAKSDLPTKVLIADYKGKPTLSLSKGEPSFVNKPFTFGKAKAQMIMEQYEAIKRFAESK
jgi:hypothetical protein